MKVIKVMEESRQSIALVTEPVVGSLANICKNYGDIPEQNVFADVKDASLSQVSILAYNEA